MRTACFLHSCFQHFLTKGIEKIGKHKCQNANSQRNGTACKNCRQWFSPWTLPDAANHSFLLHSGFQYFLTSILKKLGKPKCENANAQNNGTVAGYARSALDKGQDSAAIRCHGAAQSGSRYPGILAQESKKSWKSIEFIHFSFEIDDNYSNSNPNT